ncbi:hypothetical protein [Mycobacterium marinum]|uniref:hypothetical protein n=2 Tax=Mycobacterium marinum TaxID=1781 RepID=UPI00356A6BDE
MASTVFTVVASSSNAGSESMDTVAAKGAVVVEAGSDEDVGEPAMVLVVVVEVPTVPARAMIRPMLATTATTTAAAAPQANSHLGAILGRGGAAAGWAWRCQLAPVGVGQTAG